MRSKVWLAVAVAGVALLVAACSGGGKGVAPRAVRAVAPRAGCRG